MKPIVRNFFKGLLIVVPIVATTYLVYVVVLTLDSLLGLPIPGLGLAITLVAITLVGLLASNAVGRRLVRLLERGVSHLPVVKLLYSSIRDLMGAFVGDRKSFDQPVMVALDDQPRVRLLGFVTCTRFDDPKLRGHVAVYVPQSYNFAGNLLIVPASAVERIDADGAEFMAFIMSGGVAEMGAARTVLQSPLARPAAP